MNMKVNVRLSSIALLLALLAVTILPPLQVSVAQDDPVEKDWANLEGVGGIAQTADNLNVGPVPTQEQAQNAVNPTPLDEPLSDELPSVKSLMSPPCCPFVMSRVSKFSKLARHDLKIIWQESNDDATLVVFEDYSVVMSDADGKAWLWGYVGMSSGDGHIVIAGADSDGNHFALDNGYVIGLLADGDVLMGNPTRWYLYDYDEAGNFVGLTDGDGNNYDVATTDDGSTIITDPAGDTGDFNPDGSYDIVDQAGEALDQGALFGENDDDPVVTPDATVDAGSPIADSGDQPNATLAPDNGGDTSGGDNSDGS